MSDETQVPEQQAQVEQPVEQAAPAAEAPKSFDPGEFRSFMSRYEQERAQAAQQQQAFIQQQQQAQQESAALKEMLLRAVDPEGFKRAQQARQPRPVTHEDLNKVLTRFQQQQAAQQELAAFKSEMPQVMAKYPALAEVFGDQLQDVLLSRWERNANASLTDIAKALDANLAKSFEKRQADWAAKKDQMGERAKPVGKGAPPGPAAPKMPQGRQGMLEALMNVPLPGLDS